MLGFAERDLSISMSIRFDPSGVMQALVSFEQRPEHENPPAAFTVSGSILQETKFSDFMEGFNAKVGIPPERADESVFKFDGDKLKPNDTPEVRGQSSVRRGGGGFQ